MKQLDRQRAAAVGRETVQVLEAGRYVTGAGTVVEIAQSVQDSVAGTRAYPPGSNVVIPRSAGYATRIDVRNETTLSAARRLVDDGWKPAALNFASATNPGGGFLNGARAQEESLARSSGLYACLMDHEMYSFHRRRRDPMYTDYVIYSPDVPVIRDDDGVLLKEPYLCCILTSPAVNARVVLDRDPARRPEIRQAMQRRIAKVLGVAAAHRHQSLVLGAWGCGAFGNDAEMIADLFHESLTGAFEGVFQRIVFAITDWSRNRRFIGPFQRRFGGDA